MNTWNQYITEYKIFFHIIVYLQVVTLTRPFWCLQEDIEMIQNISSLSIIQHIYKARHAHKRLYTVLPKYSKIQVLPGITSCRLVKDNKQAIELNSLLINNMPEGGYG